MAELIDVMTRAKGELELAVRLMNAHGQQGSVASRWPGSPQQQHWLWQTMPCKSLGKPKRWLSRTGTSRIVFPIYQRRRPLMNQLFRGGESGVV
jgi:hypothetical protein